MNIALQAFKIQAPSKSIGRTMMYTTSMLGRKSSFVEARICDLPLLKRDRSQWTIDSNATVFEATKRMNDHGIGALCVTKNSKVIGIVTERDYLRKVIHEGRTSKTTNVLEISTLVPDLIVASITDSLRDCLDVMGAKSIRHLPIVNSSRGPDVIGLVSISDIARALCNQSDIALRTLDHLIINQTMPIHDG